MILLVAGCIAFVGTHFLMSHPLRAPMVARLGEKGFLGVYTLVSLATFAWMALAFRAVPPGAPLWAVGDGLWIAGSAVMLAASILFVGSMVKNPAVPDPNAAANLDRPVEGVFAVTRHPMMWAFALWGLVHIAVSPTVADFWLAGSIVFLALVGAWGQDAKKEKLMGQGWRDYEARTAFLPLGLQLSGRASWGQAVPSLSILVGGVLLWLAATFLHFNGAGIWRWAVPA